MKQVFFSPILPALRKLALSALELLWAVFVLLTIGLVILYFLIPQSPTPNKWVEKIAHFALVDVFEQADIRFTNLTIMRGDLSEPVTLKADSLRIYPEIKAVHTDTPALESQNITLEIMPFGFLHGQKFIRSVRTDTLTLVARRDAKGRYVFGLAGTRDTGGKSSKERTAIKPLASLDSIENLSVARAVLVFEDTVTRKNETIAILTLDMRRNSDFDQTLLMAYVRDNKTPSQPSLDFVLTTTAAQKEAEIIVYLNKMDINRLTPWVPELQEAVDEAQGEFTGEIRLSYNKSNNVLSRYKIELDSLNGLVRFTDSPAPLLYNNLALIMNDQATKLTAALQNRAVSLTATGNKSERGGYDVMLDIPEIGIADIAGVMKEGDDTTAQEWLTQKLKNGTMRNVKITGHVHRDDNQEWTMSNLIADMDIQNMWVLYKRDFAPADNVTAKAHYENDKLSLLFTEGSVSGMNIIEGKLDFADLTKAGAGDCKGLLRLRGPLQSVLSYLDNPIIRYKERVSVDLSKADGNVQMSLGLDFPTTKDVKIEEIKVDVDAILKNANLPDIINGVTISGGPLALKGNANDILIRGDALLNGTQAHMTYQTFFDPDTAPFRQRLDLKGALSAETLAGFGLGGWAQDVRTLSKYTISYNQPIKGKPVADMTISGNDLSVEKAGITLGQNNEFQSADLNGLIIGKTRGNLNITRNANKGMSIVFKGDTLDARSLLVSDDKKETESPAFLTADVTARKIILSDKGGLDNVTARYASNAKSDVFKLEVSGAVNGAPANIRFNETPRGDSLRVDVANAGAFLAAMDVTDGVKGGTVNITADPNGQYGSMTGKAYMTDFSARNVPVLGRLINALSLPGLFQLFTTEGVAFERLATDFTWEKNSASSVLRFKNGKTSGSSLGLTFQGSYDNTKKIMDVNGKVVPLSEINNMVKSIPLLGPLISGGKNGALVAANYSMRGSPSDPNVFINPLSILTPGLLRTLLFENEAPEPKPNP